DAELQRLPEQWRAPLICCYLQGRTQDEAARELGWTLITLRRRLAAAREKLRLRLERRGATLSAGLIAAALVPAADAAIPEAVRGSTVALAAASLQGGAIPAPITELIRGGISGALGRSKLWLGSMIATGALVSVGAIQPWITQRRAAQPPQPETSQTEAAKAQVVLRDRFNDPLPEGAIARLGTIAFRHRGEVTALAFHPDGKS